MKKLFALVWAVFSVFTYSAQSQAYLVTRDGNLPGKWAKGSFKNANGARDYYVYVPKGYNGSTAIPLMVMLHGCTQSAQEFADQTGMNIVAEKYGFAVIYPEEPSSANPMRCWNWFNPASQARGGGEMSIILGIMNQVAASVKIDTRHVFVAGLSAGAAMASNLMACYSDVFSGAGIHSGLDYKAATSQNEAFTAMSQGSSYDPKKTGVDAARCTGNGARMATVIVFHGKADQFVNPLNADQVVRQFSKMNDILDDGQDNESQTATPIGSHQGTVPNGHSYTMTVYGGRGSVHVAEVLVDGMKHAWSGAAQSGQYADPAGPNASEMMWEFFLNYSSRR